jgi:hypothetical protein
MEALDLKKFAWNRNHENFKILAITTFLDHDVVVYQKTHGNYKVDIATVDEFCRDFQATYHLT